MSRSSARKPQVAIIGYGSQGRALALNLSDSGYSVSIGLRPRSASRRLARKEGFESVLSIPRAVQQANFICFAFPDHCHSKVYESEIGPHLSSGATLLFLHGMSVHFGFLKPPTDCDVVLLAPHAPGSVVRDRFLGDRSLSAFIAVYQDHSGAAKKSLKALAKAAGFKTSKLMTTSFEQEAVGDMFGEQAVLCGGMAGLVKNGFEVLIENGFSAEKAYLEVAYQLDLIIDLIKKYGIEGMMKRISVAARYGSHQVAGDIIDASVKRRMHKIYERIASGEFPAALNNLSPSDLAKLDNRLGEITHPLLEKAARKFSR